MVRTPPTESSSSCRDLTANKYSIMTDKERKIRRLIDLAQNDETLIPPCCEEFVLELFDSYFHLWLPQCSNSGAFAEDMLKKYPDLSEAEIVRLKEYLSSARKYLLDICCTFAGIYQNYGALPRNYYESDQKYCDILINACLKKYTWLTDEYLYENLWQICRLCNW